VLHVYFVYVFGAGIFKQSMGARNRIEIGLSYRPARLHGWRNFFLGIDSWVHKRLKIRARIATHTIDSDDYRVHTEWQRPLSGVHSIVMENSALAGEGGGGCTPNPLHSLPSRPKLPCTLQLRGQIHVYTPRISSLPYMYSVVMTTEYIY
jgi:hypothetical protein